MKAKQTARPIVYQEARSALSWPLLAWGLFGPGTGMLACAILGITVNPAWLLGIVFIPLFGPFLVYISLLYRNWPTGIRIDEAGIAHPQHSGRPAQRLGITVSQDRYPQAGGDVRGAGDPLPGPAYPRRR